jgi:CDP-glucose 4,6-dehydratase
VVPNSALAPSARRADIWSGCDVFLTGHTGFKGGWLAMRLARAGARVHGFALPPPTDPSLFGAADVAATLASHTVGDIRDGEAVERALRAAKPSVVFHLAAQPLVRESYRDPVGTYAVNVVGTANVLEAVRRNDCVRAVVSVTTDKCYENREWEWGYRESDALGGHDPYSSSKACAELVTASYRSSFLTARGVRVASARAGNVIGGGDWAPDRLVPDFLRASLAGRSLEIRHPGATRPWQHVLEPIEGYVRLAEELLLDGAHAEGAWNFGPADDDVRSVADVLDLLRRHVAGAGWHCAKGARVHEAGLLKLDSSKARHRLGWRPVWRLEEAVARTAEWHEAWRRGAPMRAICSEQIAAHAA